MKNLLQLKRTEVLKYALYFICFLLLCRAETMGGLKPFHVGFFVGLCYAKQNVYVLAPLYVIAGLITAFSLPAIITTLAVGVIFLIAITLHRKFNKPLSIVASIIYAVVAQLPSLCLSFLYTKNAVTGVLNIIISTIFCFCAIIILYAVLVRGLRYRFATDELASLGILIMALALGLFNFKIMGYRPFFVIAGFLLIASIYTFGVDGIIISLLIGLGAGLEGANIAYTAVFTLMAVVALIFRNTSIYLMAGSVVLMDVFAGLFFGVYGTYSYIQLAMLSAGVAAFLVIPRKVRVKLLAYTTGIKDRYAAKTIVNRSRKDVAHKLSEIASIFYNMEDVLNKTVTKMPEIGECKKGLAQKVANSICEKCERKNDCFGQLGQSTASEIEKVINSALKRNKATLLDLTPFITSRCNKTNNILAIVNTAFREFAENKIYTDSADTSKILISQQMQGVGQVLSGLSREINLPVAFDSVSEKLILEKLSAQNVVASEVIVYGKKNTEVNVTIVVRECDKSKRVIEKVISNVLNTDMAILSEKTQTHMGFATINLTVAPKYNIVFGESNTLKAGSPLSGDTKSVTRLSHNKVLIALCDGMGSGTKARHISDTTIAMIENFYKAGFESELVIGLTNKLLNLRNEENFSALDVAVLDLMTGKCDFIKMGAGASIIKNNSNLEIIESEDAPIGILEKISPKSVTKSLNGGDMVVLCSDGIIDSLSIKGLIKLVDSEKTINPQSLADTILTKAKNNGRMDDMTVLTFRLYKKNKNVA